MVPDWLCMPLNNSVPISRVAVALGPTSDGGGWHTGILFRRSGTAPEVLHFAWNRVLKLDQYTSIERWAPVAWVEPAVPKRLVPHLLAMARVIYERHKHGDLTYSFRYQKTVFEPHAGDVIFGQFETGFTCASFVLSFFATYGIRLLDVSTWVSRPDDSEWHRFMVKLFEENRVPSGDIENARQDIGCFRYRPEEVAGGSSIVPLPANFEQAKAAAAEIRKAFKPA